MSHCVTVGGRKTDHCIAPELYFKKNDQEIVLFCGSPGAGKSTFYWKQLQPLGFERVNQDILKTVSCTFN
jgi:energy-coupling factor transporter ATP-binding protein EcfA2